MNRKLRVLLFSTLYPGRMRPGHGVFVETRMRELLGSGQVDTRVVAPVPWFFSTHPRYGQYARMAGIPEREVHHGVDILHPRYVQLPRVGMSLAPFTMALAALPAIRQLHREGFDPDLIDAHYYYPDGVAAALVAKWLGKPVVVTARGSDINLIARHAVPRQLICWAAGQARASISVSQALCDGLVALGAERSKLQVLRNGVDLTLFRPARPASARAALGIPDVPTLISVGNLVENKGHHIVIAALTQLPEFRLLVVGAGPQRSALEALASTLGVAGRVDFAGRVVQENLPVYYSAADMLVLASSREGWPNVLLEAMACGTPVVATKVGGIPEIVTAPVAGRLTAERSVAGFVSAIRAQWQAMPARADVRRHAEAFSWQSTTDAQLALFRSLVADEVAGHA